MSLETMTKLATATVGVGGVASVTFSNIPQNYTDLVIVTSIRSSTTGSAGAGYQERLNIYFNGTTADYSERWIQAEGGTSTGSGTNYFNSSGSNGLAGTAVPSDWTANTFNNNQIYILNYSSNNFKSFSIDGVAENNGSFGSLMLAAGLWSNPAAITSISISLRNTPNMVQYSTVSLYGVKNARQTAGNSIKATGGNIVFDGTYVYHVFNASGTFAPTQGFLADYLVIGGGGAGSPSRSGGGGAGGLLSSIEATGGGGTLQPEVSFVPTSYTVTVGAGGATALDAVVYSGSNSAITGFTTPLIAIGGGGGGNSGAGGGASGAGALGGSGGGGLQGPTDYARA